MIWLKTDSGRAEMGARALVPERARRNLLLLIDGIRSQDTLLGVIAGIDRGDFDQLARLGLIAKAPTGTTPTPRPVTAAASARVPSSTPEPAPVLDVIVGEPPSYGQLTAKLTHLISSELGLRGFRLTLAVEKAADVKELEPVAERVIAEIAKRKGGAAADTARRALYGS